MKRTPPAIRPGGRPRSTLTLPMMAAAGLATLAIWAYATSFEGVFVFDDGPAIVENQHIRSLWPIWRAMGAPDEVTVSGRPIAALSFAINYALAPDDARDVMAPSGPNTLPGAAARFHRNVWGYHVANLLIHVAAGLVLFGVVRRTLLTEPLRDRFGDASGALALVIAAIWIAHPLHTGAVTYLVQRVESLMSLFFLLTLYCAIRAHEAGGRKSSLWWVAAAVVSCGLGMGTKEVMVSAPIVVLVWRRLFVPTPAAGALVPTGRTGARLLIAGLAATWLILVGLVAAETRPHSVGLTHPDWTPWSYLLTQAEVLTHYLRLAFVPFPLVIDYGWPRVESFQAVAPEFVALSAAAIATVVGLVRRWPAAFPGAWFFLILAPSSSVLPIFTEVAAEHRMYLPLAAVIGVVVLVVYRVWPSGRAATVALASGVIVAIALGAVTRERNRVYLDEEALWQDAVLKRPANARARVTYGMTLSRAGKYAEAESQLRTAVALDNGNSAAHLNLGAVLSSRRAYEEGIAQLEQAVLLDKDSAGAYGNLGEAYAATGRVPEAAQNFLEAIARRPDDAFLLNRAAWLLATAADDRVRNGARAVELAERAMRVTGGTDLVSLDSMAAAYAEVGRATDAAAVAAEATRLARLQRRMDALAELAARVALYRSGRRIRCTPHGDCTAI